MLFGTDATSMMAHALFNVKAIIVVVDVTSWGGIWHFLKKEGADKFGTGLLGI